MKLMNELIQDKNLWQVQTIEVSLPSKSFSIYRIYFLLYIFYTSFVSLFLARTIIKHVAFTVLKESYKYYHSPDLLSDPLLYFPLPPLG